MMIISRKARVFWPICSLLLLADCGTKGIAVEKIGATDVPIAVLNGIIRFTLAYNPDAAMGLSLGPLSRVGFAIGACLALAVLGTLYRRTPSHSTWQLVALALICGGAAGNLLDRIRSARGVVDFIDVGIGPHRFWWVFNIADLGVMTGAALLAVSIWRSGDVQQHSVQPTDHTVS